LSRLSKNQNRGRIDAKKAAGNRCRFTAAFQRLSKSPPTYPYNPLRKADSISNDGV
jgi:hypothetical protein